MVRDGVSTLRVCLLHHLALGCEHIHVVDNGSRDGTSTVLARLERKLPISWSYDPGAYRQHDVVSELVREQSRLGADWVLPLDDDEFWSSRRPLQDLLADAAHKGAGAVRAQMVCFAQRRHVRRATARALLTMDHRPATTYDPITGQELVEAGRASFLEYAYPPKLVLRASTEVRVLRGSHHAEGLAGPVIDEPDLELLHAPLLARETLERKAEHGDRLEAAGYIDREGWHVRRWAALARAGALDREWPSLSVDDRGCVLVGDETRPFVRDTRLSEAVARWIRPRHMQAAARVLRRSV